MRTKQRAEIACGRRAMLAELGIADGPGKARRQSAGYGCKCPECDAAQWDMRRLKYWLCGRLLAFGADVAEVDRRVDGVPVDIYWRKGEREFVIEVRSGSLERTLAQEHTQRMRAAGITEVLWLCPPGYWVDHLHALGIADFAPPACDYLAVRGMLDTVRSAVAAPRRDPFELRDFIHGWVTGDIVWGYRDVTTGGWATVADWEHHTRTQATIIARQRQELVNQRTALALSRKTVRDKQKNVMKLTTRLERAELEAQERADALAQARRKLDDHHRVDTTLRNTIKSLQQTINHWQLVTCCAMMLIVTFVAGALVVR
ncbi:hypothetical protein [Nocardia brasiliensis]|uniref:hypothetical protein n=1 Tax=Nocardia brasiliensis TaxID=37326 RepID=UPI000313503E|nr:hypothetical protein [Nocardia brasiliensis]SUB53999.1 Uncharacterised protein [Nocardia brasiliensis]